MPLTYDDEPGSWGRHSVGWPSIVFDTEAAHNEARSLVIKNNLVPYGSYVSVGKELRLETQAHKLAVLNAVRNSQMPIQQALPSVTKWTPTTNISNLRVLGKAVEETGELQQVLARCIIQGIDEKQPGTDKRNRDWLIEEIADVQATIAVLAHHYRLDEKAIHERSLAKRVKLDNWRKLLEGEA